MIFEFNFINVAFMLRLMLCDATQTLSFTTSHKIRFHNSQSQKKNLSSKTIMSPQKKLTSAQAKNQRDVKVRVEIMRSIGLNGLNRRLQIRNPKIQHFMSWFTAHKIGPRSNLWLSILFIHSHFVEINQRFTRHSFICYMLILNNINSIGTTDGYLPDRRCVNLIYMLI